MRYHEFIVEAKKKNCGCGKDPCITYGTQKESTDELIEFKLQRKGSKGPAVKEMQKMLIALGYLKPTFTSKRTGKTFFFFQKASE